jgi:hypothetical protein
MERRRKVVPGTRAIFKEDLKIEDALLQAELALPGLAIPPFEEFTILHRDRFWRLAEKHPAEDRVELAGLAFDIVERSTVGAVEEEVLRARACDVERARREFLKALRPEFLDAAGSPARTEFNREVARAALEKIEAAFRKSAGDAAHPQEAAGGERVRLPSPPSQLASLLPGHDRLLFLDGRRYDLLTPAEFFERWKKGFHPAVVEDVLKPGRAWTAQMLADFLAKKADRASPKALSVVRSRLHRRHGPLRVALDGADFVPEERGRAADFLADWARALSHAVKRSALQPFLEEGP